MNAAHWHLLLNHLPIVGIILGTLILIAGFILKNSTIKQTSLGVFILAALFAIPAFLTGEGAEEIAEKLPGVTNAGIENHEDIGKTFLIAIELSGLLALVTFLAAWRNMKAAGALYIIVFIVAIVTSLLAKQAATSGGEIRHTEIRNGIQPDNAAEQNNAHETDD